MFSHFQSGRTLTLRVAATHSIALVKALVFRRAGFPTDQQRLIFGSRQLEDHRTLADYGIQEGAVLHLVFGLRGGMQIFVETLTGETITLDVTASDTVKMAKTKIQEKIRPSRDSRSPASGWLTTTSCRPTAS